MFVQFSIMGVTLTLGFYKTAICLNHNEPYLIKVIVVKSIWTSAIYPFSRELGINIIRVDPHAVHLVWESPATMNPFHARVL